VIEKRDKKPGGGRAFFVGVVVVYTLFYIPGFTLLVGAYS